MTPVFFQVFKDIYNYAYIFPSISGIILVIQTVNSIYDLKFYAAYMPVINKMCDLKQSILS